MINRMPLAPALLLALVALPAYATKPAIQWNKDYDFDAVNTFQWYALEDSTLRDANPFMDSLIKNLIEAELATSGLTEVTENPDVVVVYYAAVNTELRLQSSSYGYSWAGYGGGGWGHYGYGAGPVSTTTRAYEIEHGTLVVDIWDVASEELVWRGTVEDIMPSDPEKAEKLVTKAIGKMVAQGRKLWANEKERRIKESAS